ncbi:hypothetical protein AVW11_27775 [Streptomyces amritsarensis]|uniref:MFS transporter n=1 Tax=Streptomyces amritsarensis TaxID=681158 RepID=A0ABX3FV89_9ACTN|nr:hypothetical protein AVW11_27775 [Streptomyces amritsarensis]
MAFVRPALRDVSGTDAGCVGTLLFGYGVAGVAGNLLAGARDAYRTPLHRGPAGTGPRPRRDRPAARRGLAHGGVSVSVHAPRCGWASGSRRRAGDPAPPRTARRGVQPRRSGRSGLR